MWNNATKLLKNILDIYRTVTCNPIELLIFKKKNEILIAMFRKGHFYLMKCF